MFELWGKPASNLLNKPIFEGLPEAKNQGFEGLLGGVYSSGKPYSAEGVPVTLPRNDKVELTYVNFVYAPYREIDGKVSGILAIAVDVTAQILARQKIEEIVKERTYALENANKDLEKSNTELAQFAYITSHDLQEPIRKISTFSEMLKNKLSDRIDDESMSYLNKIGNSSSRMITLIKDVLNYSELIKESDEFDEVDLNIIAQNVLSEYDLSIEQNGVTVRVSNLSTIEANRIQMTQLFGNLIGNSLKFIGTNVRPIITISEEKLTVEELENPLLRKDLEYIKIKFTDNGIGFKKEYSEQIFGIFQRLHRKSAYAGTGIGLALCRKIALNHQGTINAQGSSEDGAVFNLIIPKKQILQIKTTE